ncbi:hypothetical protein H0H93_005702 [Arthromyces matolae]|nr:hypothetical protein H0H93_005702 [Arthromyces matolae]
MKTLLKTALWGTYYWVQGMVWAGIFCLGHDAGHGTLFENNRVNNVVGFVLHTVRSGLQTTHYIDLSVVAIDPLLRLAHNTPCAPSSMERDENYIPYLRSEYNLPPSDKSKKFDYAEVFEETPIWTLFRIFIMQGFGWWLYLAQNTMGSKMYPPGTNHFDPHSPLFKPEQRKSIVISNIALTLMLSAMVYVGPGLVLKYYLVPYLLTNHWKSEWSFLRGAAATVDRPLLGWCGRFFFHNISHDHVAHHFFIKAPFYNGPQITKAIKMVLKEDYNYDSTPTWYALYRSFTQCLFVEEDGDILFYKNKYGKSARELADTAVKEIKETGWKAEAQDSNIEFPKLG